MFQDSQGCIVRRSLEKKRKEKEEKKREGKKEFIPGSTSKLNE